MINNRIIHKFFKDFTKHRKKLTGHQFLAVDLFPTFFNTRTTDEMFQQSGKQDLRHFWKSLANMYESVGSQFFKTTTRIQSGRDTFDKSRFITIFGSLTILGVTEILCSFKLV